jgi:hypothetical protein
LWVIGLTIDVVPAEPLIASPLHTHTTKDRLPTSMHFTEVHPSKKYNQQHAIAIMFLINVLTRGTHPPPLSALLSTLDRNMAIGCTDIKGADKELDLCIVYSL